MQYNRSQRNDSVEKTEHQRPHTFAGAGHCWRTGPRARCAGAVLTRVVRVRRTNARLVAEAARERRGGADCSLRRRRVGVRKRRSSCKIAVVGDDCTHEKNERRVLRFFSEYSVKRFSQLLSQRQLSQF